MRIALYLAVPSFAEERESRRPFTSRAKDLLVQILDVAFCVVARRTSFHFSRWRAPGLNKGDIALRKAIKEQLRKAFAPRAIRFDELEWGSLKAEMADEIGRSSDLFVIAGSGYVAPDPEGDAPKRMFDDLAFLRRLKIPKIAYGIGFNQLIENERALDATETLPIATGDVLRSLLTEMDLISVRDDQTRQLIERLTARHSFLTGDPALFYGTGRAERPLKPRLSRIRMGLNLAMHGPAAAKRLPRDFPAYRALLRAIAREHCVEFHYVPHASGERIFWYLLLAHGIFVRWHDPKPENLVGFYSGLDLHVCQMLHSSILSVNAGIPTINIAYDVKNLEFFNLMGLARFCHSSSDLDAGAVLASVRSALAERREIEKTIEDRKVELRMTLEGFLTSVVELTANRARRSQPIGFAEKSSYDHADI